MANVEIRAPEPHDVADLAEMFRCPGVVSNTLQLPWRSVEFRRERLVLNSPERHSLVAVVDGRAVGMLDLHLQQSPRRRQSGEIGMAVHDEYQGQGIGSALMTAMLDLADNWIGLRRIELTVFTENGPGAPKNPRRDSTGGFG